MTKINQQKINTKSRPANHITYYSSLANNVRKRNSEANNVQQTVNRQTIDDKSRASKIYTYIEKQTKH